MDPHYLRQCTRTGVGDEVRVRVEVMHRKWGVSRVLKVTVTTIVGIREREVDMGGAGEAGVDIV